VIHHRPTILGALIGALLVTLAILALSARAHAQPLDAGPDPVVLSDHAAPLPALTLPDEPPPAKAAPGPLDRILEVAGPVGRGALGGMACLAVAWLLARARERWGWLRRGWAGNAAATAYAALTTFGAVVAVGGSVGAGLTMVGGAMVTGMALGKDPETAKTAKLPHAVVVAGDVEVPT
jgi:hypothetical protein